MIQVFNKLRHFLKSNGKETINYVFVHGLNQIVPIVSYFYINRILNSEDWGNFSILLSINLILQNIIEFGHNQLLTIELLNGDFEKRGKERINAILSQKVLLMLAVSSFYLVLYTFFIDEVYSLTEIIFALSATLLFGNLPIWFYQGNRIMDKLSVLLVISRIVFLVVVLLFVRGTETTWVYWLAYTLSLLIVNLIGYRACFCKNNFKISDLALSFSGKRFWTNFKEDSLLFQNNFFSMLYLSSNNLVIAIFLGNVEAGFFSTAEKIYRLFKQALSPLANSLLPIYSKYQIDKPKLVRAVLKYYFGVFPLLLIGIVLAYFYGDDAMLLLDPSNEGNTYLVVCYFVVTIFAFFNHCFVQGVFMNLKMLREIRRFSMITAFVCLMCSFILVNIFGILGPILAIIMAEFVLTLQITKYVRGWYLHH